MTFTVHTIKKIKFSFKNTKKIDKRLVWYIATEKYLYFIP